MEDHKTRAVFKGSQDRKMFKNMQYCMVSDLDDEFMQKRSSASYTVLLYTLETRQQFWHRHSIAVCWTVGVIMGLESTENCPVYLGGYIGIPKLTPTSTTTTTHIL